MADATDLEALCEELLSVCEQALDTLPNTDPDLLGAPERAAVWPGPPADDCCDDGQLAVWTARITNAPTKGGLDQGTLHRIQGFITWATVNVKILRCVQMSTEDGDAPDPAVMQEAAEQTNADIWAIWNDTYWAARDGQLGNLCKEVFWDGAAPITPSGGCVGWLL